MSHYPFLICRADGSEIDRAGNVESTLAILYGDLSTHDGEPRTVFAPTKDVPYLRWNAEINADCYGIPLDHIQEQP